MVLCTLILAHCWGWGVCEAIFSAKNKTNKKDIGLNTGFGLKIIFRHTYFFFTFWVGGPSSAWILVRMVGKPLNLSREAI